MMPLLPRRIDFAHPEELGLAVLVVGVVLVVLYYIFRLTVLGARRGEKAELPTKPYRCVLMPSTQGLGYGEEAVTLACRLAGPGSGNVGPSQIILSYVIEVPRSLAIDAAMPDAEAEAERALNQAAESVRACGLQPVTQIRKARSVVDETMRAVQEQKADLLVLTPSPAPAPSPSPSSAVTQQASNTAEATANEETCGEIARRAPCEVVLARAGRGAQEQPQQPPSSV